MSSKDERRAELEAELEELKKEDESDEVEIGLGEGKYFRGSYSRAKKLGYVKEPESKGDSGANPSKAEGEVKRFTAGRRTG